MPGVMSDPEKPAETPVDDNGHRATTQGHRDARAEALEKALRDNLRRRKAAGSAPAKSNHENARENGEQGS